MAFLTGFPLLAAGCTPASTGTDALLEDAPPPLDLQVCDLTRGPFVASVDNGFFPLAIGATKVLEGLLAPDTVRAEWTVLDATEDVAGVATRVVEEKTFTNAHPTAVVRHYYAQAPDGTVCNFGRDVDRYKDGEVIDHVGTWRAGGDAMPGIEMPPDPDVGQNWVVDTTPRSATRNVVVTGKDVTVVVPAGTYTDTLIVSDWTPGQKTRSARILARGAGLVVEGTMLLQK